MDENGSAANGSTSTAISTAEIRSDPVCAAQSNEQSPLLSTATRVPVTMDGAITPSPTRTKVETSQAEPPKNEESQSSSSDRCWEEASQNAPDNIRIASPNVDGNETISVAKFSTSHISPHLPHSAVLQYEQSKKGQHVDQIMGNTKDIQSDPQGKEYSSEGKTFFIETEMQSKGKSNDDNEVVASFTRREEETDSLTDGETETESVTMDMIKEDYRKPNAKLNKEQANIVHSSTDNSNTDIDASSFNRQVSSGPDMFEATKKSQHKHIVNRNSMKSSKNSANNAEYTSITNTVIEETECSLKISPERDTTSLKNPVDSVAERHSLPKMELDSNSDGLAASSIDYGCHSNGGDIAGIEEKEDDFINQENGIEAKSPSLSSANSLNHALELPTATSNTSEFKMNGDSFTVDNNSFEEYFDDDTVKPSLANTSSGSSSSSSSSSGSSSGNSSSNSSKSSGRNHGHNCKKQKRKPTEEQYNWHESGWMRDNMVQQHISPSVNPLKRRASDTPLDTENERRPRLFSGEIESKQVKLSAKPSPSIVPGSPDVSYNVLNEGHIENDEDKLQPDTSEQKQDDSFGVAGLHCDLQKITASQPELNVEQCSPNTEEILSSSSGCGKSLLPSTTTSFQVQVDTIEVNFSSSNLEKNEMIEARTDVQFPDEPQPIEDELQRKENEDDEGNSSSSESSSSSSNSSSSSSSSTSSDSEGTGDEAEDVDVSSSAHPMSVENARKDDQEGTGKHPASHGNNLPEREQSALSGHHISEDNTRDSAAMEIDESAAESEEEDDLEARIKRDDEVKITRSEGLKLSISLKRSSTVATPTRSEESPMITMPAAAHLQSQPPLQPVDFSNLLKKGLLLNESQELIKIDYNQLPDSTYSQQDLPRSDADLQPKTRELHHPKQQLKEVRQQSPAPWNNDAVFDYGAGNVLKNTLQSNHLAEKLATSIPFVPLQPQDESSDTLDEDNRLVIAEKQQRCSRKRTHQIPLIPPAATTVAYPSLLTRHDNHLFHTHLQTLPQQLRMVPQSTPHLIQNPHCPYSNIKAIPANFPIVAASSQLSTPNSINSTSPTLKGTNTRKRPAGRRKRAQVKAGTVPLGVETPRCATSNKQSKMGASLNIHQQQAGIVGCAVDVQNRSNLKPSSKPRQVPDGAELTPLVPEGVTEKKKDKKKVFLCSPCGTHYENWNLFLHMREVHRKHICLYCLGIFQSAERLVNHLGMKHGVQKKHHGSLEEYLQLYNYQVKNGTTLSRFTDNVPPKADSALFQQPFYLMCSRCEHMFESNIGSKNLLESSEQHIIGHNCADYLETCGHCGQLKLSKHRCDAGFDYNGTGGDVENKKKTSKKSLASTNMEVNGMDISGINMRNETLKGRKKVSKKREDKKKQQHTQQHTQQQRNELQLNVRGSILESQLLKNAPNAAFGIPGTPTADLTVPKQSLYCNPADHLRALNQLQHHTIRSQPCAENYYPMQNHPVATAPIVSTTPSSNETNETLLAMIEKPADVPPPATPLVPKLKVKIPIQYLTPMESEESSMESDEGNEEEEEEEQEWDEDEGEEGGQKVDEENGAKGNQTYVMDESKTELMRTEMQPHESMDLCLGAANPEETNETGNVSATAPIVDPNDPERSTTLLETLEDTLQQETIAMDIGEMVTPNPSDDHFLPSVKSPEKLVLPVAAETSEVKIEPFGNEEQDSVSFSQGLQLQHIPTSSVLQHDSGSTSVVGAESNDERVGMDAEILKTRKVSSPMDEIETPDLSGTDQDGLVIADSDAQLFQLSLDEPLDRIPIREFIKICLGATVPFCLYCNHARRIAVSARQLVLHIIATHRFQATVNSITGEELQPETILIRFRAALNELGAGAYLNVETFDNGWTAEKRASVPFVRQFECFQCRFVTLVHKELYLHNRKMHQKSVLVCLMCRGTFFSYSELLCHLCPGVANQMTILDYTFRCCVCNVDAIPSAFRLMVHLRKRHFACDVCLEESHDQGRLSNHVWKHKLHHLCYRCGIGYRNKADILKHLFWKHGTEGVLCKRCLQKKWPHVYHFCVPPAQFVCEVCQATFGRSMALKVHKRLHDGDTKYPCTEDGCEKRFISKKLLLKHVQRHFPDAKEEQRMELTNTKQAHSLVDGEADVPSADGESVTVSVKEQSTEIKREDGGVDSEKQANSEEDVNERRTGVKDPSTEIGGEEIMKCEKSNETYETTDKDGTDGNNQKNAAVKKIMTSNEEDMVHSKQPDDLKVPMVGNEPPLKKSKKKRKGKDDDKSMVDLMNLPALNLSESDSSDESDNENSNASLNPKLFQEWSNASELTDANDNLARNNETLTETRARLVEGDEMLVAKEIIEVKEDSVAGPTKLPNDFSQQDMHHEDAKDKMGEGSETRVAAPCMDPIANIWNNFKRYQAHNRTASRRQSADEEQKMEDELVMRMMKHTILHVSQSDHDYCMMYKPVMAESETCELRSSQHESLLLKRAAENSEEGIRNQRKSEASRSPRKRTTDHSSDSDNSSDSDSSCECGPNCSCTSSSSNSSSSSSEDSDSSNEGSGRRSKKDTTRERRTLSPGHGKNVDKAAGPTAPIEATEEIAMLWQAEPQEPVDPDSVIVDSDLQTDESDTDEEFYDEHPQKLANQMLAEKRRQLIAQTCAVTATGGSPGMMSYDIVENSRPSTPSLPPEEQQGKKKLKMKKRKRERKSSKRMFSPSQTTNMTVGGEKSVPSDPSFLSPYGTSSTTSNQWMQQPCSFMPATVSSMGLAEGVGSSLELLVPQGTSMAAMVVATTNNPSSIVPPLTIPMPAALIAAGGNTSRIGTARLSTGNSSESDAPLKRSQRSRKPNKFYGYTSDDESAAASLLLPAGIPLSVNPEKSILSLMKPTPPPNLVWSKEDLPSPPAKSNKGTVGGGSVTIGGAGSSGTSKTAIQSTQRRSVDHSTPVLSRRNSGVGMVLDEMSGALPGEFASQALLVPAMQAAINAMSVATPDQQHRPPLPKLKLSLGKKASRASLGTPKRSQINRRRKGTPKTPKTPKSAPPLLNSAPLSAPPVPPPTTSAPMYHPPIVDTRPKIPPIGSFPSVQTDLFRPSQIRVPAGWRAPREGESVYCYCRAPYDEVSEMIACDGEHCRIEWFHFECVGIIMPPKGKWFCPECKLKQPPLVDQSAHHGEPGRVLPHPTTPNGPTMAVQSSSSLSSDRWGHSL